MSLSWSAVAGTYISMTVASLGPVGTGSYTIVCLCKPAGANHGEIGMQVSASYDIQVIGDLSIWFGGGDFSGFGTSTTDWQVIGQSKAGGTNVYRWHYWNYDLGGAKTHADGSGTHADPGAITTIRIGDGDNRGNGLIAVVAVWKRVLSDGEFDSLCTGNLSDWATLAPDALWPLNVPAASVVDTTGNGNNAASVSGTITSGADPAGFSYALAAGAPGPAGPALPLPLLYELAARNQAQWQGGAASTPAAVGGSDITGHTATAAAAAKGTSAAASSSARAATATASVKGVARTAVGSARAAVTASGVKGAAAAAAPVGHPATVAPGAKQSTGTAAAATRPNVAAAATGSAASGAATLAPHTATAAAGAKKAAANAASVGRAVVVAVGVKKASGSTPATARTAGTGAGAKKTLGTAAAPARGASSSTAARAARGTATATARAATGSAGVQPIGALTGRVHGPENFPTGAVTEDSDALTGASTSGSVGVGAVSPSIVSLAGTIG